MIQFYESRPANPMAAFVYFESVFRRQFLAADDPSEEEMHNYASRLLIAKRELDLTILPKWSLPEEDYAIEGFSNEMFKRFQRDVISRN